MEAMVDKIDNENSIRIILSPIFLKQTFALL